MVNRDEAVALARQWLTQSPRLGPDTEIGVYEFDLGFVVWAVRPPTSPPEIGGARAVVDRTTGEITTWPMMPVKYIADRYRTTQQARTRFPDDVYQDLTQAGWRPGRDISSSVRQWSRDSGLASEFDLFDAATAALDEFGGLRIAQRGPNGELDRGFGSTLYPQETVPTTREIHDFGRFIATPVFPLGGNADSASHLVIDERGRVFKLHPMAHFFVADSMDAALVWMTRGGDLPEVLGPDRWEFDEDDEDEDEIEYEEYD